LSFLNSQGKGEEIDGHPREEKVRDQGRKEKKRGRM